MRPGWSGFRGLAARFLPVPVSFHVQAGDLVARQPEAARVLAQEATHEDGRREVPEALLLDRLQVGAPDLGLLGDGLDRQVQALPGLAQLGAAARNRVGRRILRVGRQGRINPGGGRENGGGRMDAGRIGREM